MSRQFRGQKAEALASKLIHSQMMPLLIDARFLRRRGLGQVDVSAIGPKKIVLYEVKAGTHSLPSKKQFSRLRSSAAYLGQLFEKGVSLKVFSPHLSVAF